MSDMPPRGPGPRSGPPVPDDPDTGDLPAAETTFGPDFGLESSARPSWVPEKSAPLPGDGGSGVRPSTSSPTSLTAPGTQGARPSRSLRRVRVQTWHVVAVLAGALTPVVLWIVNSHGEPADLVGGPVFDRPPSRVTSALPRATTGGPTLTLPTASVTGPVLIPPQPTRSQPSRVPMPSPPVLIPVPSIPVTPLPKGAQTIRFEAQAEGGALIEVSLSDATHLRHDYPAQRSPVAFEVPVTPTVSSSDYYNLRVRTPSGQAGTRPDVFCRILVDGVVVTSQQGQGYATCYISPYNDIRRT